MDCYQAAIPRLKAMCDVTRLRILSMLRQRGEMNACEIHHAFCCTQPTISYHMRLLVDTGLVRARRDGCQVLYSVNEQIWPLAEALLAALCTAEGENE